MTIWRSASPQRRTGLPKATKPIARGPVKASNSKRKAKSFARAYGSKARVAWVQAQPCVVCQWTPCENAHIAGGGAGRKADAASIIPLCRLHHAEQHQFGVSTFAARHGLDLEAWASLTDAKWLAEGLL